MTVFSAESLKRSRLGSAKKELIRVLHVDDDAGFLKVSKRIMEKHGNFQVETASSVDEALEKLKEKTFEAVISDYLMPGKDGLELLEELRCEGNNIPFIIFTGKGREEVAIKALNLGADSYFNKVGDLEVVFSELIYAVHNAVERKRALEEVSQKEESLKAIFASCPEGIIISDLQGKILDCNAEALKLAGFSSKEEVIGRNSFEFIAERDRERALENMKRTFEQGVTKNMEYAFLTKDGKEYQGELSASVLKDSSGNSRGFVGMLRDVTERKEAEQKIMVRDRAIASFINAVAFTDLQGNLTFVNQAFLNMWGYDDEKEVLGKPATEFWHLREKASEVMETVRDKGSWTGELTAKKADGSTFNVHLSASIVKDNVGKPVSMMASFIDTTEQNQLRNKLTMANEKLNVIGNLTRHAIRDKIAALSENVFLAEQKAAHNDQVLEHLDRIKQALKLIEKILNFAEAYERTSVEKLVYLDVRETFTEAVSLFPDLKGVKIVNECGGLTVLADSLLRQIFYNLIDNSLRYAEKASQIRVRYKTGKDELELVYEDDGVGVPEAEKEKTFKKAHRKNTDYGLYLIKKAFEVYGWTIRETGIPGKGAQFIITIPKTRGGREENYRISRRL